jgi:hypothetical protein
MATVSMKYLWFSWRWYRGRDRVALDYGMGWISPIHEMRRAPLGAEFLGWFIRVTNLGFASGRNLVSLPSSIQGSEDSRSHTVWSTKPAPR